MYGFHFSVVLNAIDVSLTQGWTGVDAYFRMTKDPQQGSGKYNPHTFISGHACTAFFSLLLLNASFTQGWTGGVHSYFEDPQPGSGKCGPHTSCSGHACTAFISLKLLNAIDALLTHGWTGVVDAYFRMTKDPQPGSDKYGPHTFFSGHACTAFISLLYGMLSMFLSLKFGQGF